MIDKNWQISRYKIVGIAGIMVSVLSLSAVERGFDPRLGQTKDYKIGICCFLAISWREQVNF
jgi:hypothetical protein